MKVYLNIEQREFIVEAALKLASSLQEQMPSDKPQVRELCEEKIQHLRMLADLLKVQEYEK